MNPFKHLAALLLTAALLPTPAYADFLALSGLGDSMPGMSGGVGGDSLSTTLKISKEVTLKCQQPPYKMQAVDDLWFMQTEPCPTQMVDTKPPSAQILQIKGKFCFMNRTSGGGCSNPAFAGAWLPTDGIALVAGKTTTLPTPPVIEGYGGSTAKPGTIALTCLPGKTSCTGQYKDELNMKMKTDTLTQNGTKIQEHADGDSLIRGVQGNASNPIFKQGLANQSVGSGVNLDNCVMNAMAGATTAGGKMHTCNDDKKAQKETTAVMVSASAGKTDCKDAISCIKTASTTSRWTESCESQIPLQLQQCETKVPVKQCKIYRQYDYTSCDADRKVECRVQGTVLAGTCSPTVITGAELHAGKMDWDSTSVAVGTVNIRTGSIKVSSTSRIKTARITRLGFDDWVKLKINGVTVSGVDFFADYKLTYGPNHMHPAGFCSWFGDGCRVVNGDVVNNVGTVLGRSLYVQDTGHTGGWVQAQAVDIDLKPYLKDGDNTLELYSLNITEHGIYHLTFEFDEYCVACTESIDRSACAVQDAAPRSAH